VTNRKRKLFLYLVCSAVVLLIINITIDSIKKPKKVTAIHELTVSQIESVFFKVLDSYGIEQKWISKKKYKMTEDDSIKTQYEVKIPADMPVPLIIKDINKIIEKDITGFVSEEKVFFGTTEIRIYTNEILKLKATLVPDKEIIRNRNDLSFVISDAFDLGTSDFNLFLRMNYPIACLVIPSQDNITKTDTMKNYTKDFVMYLSDDISDSNMKMKQDYQKELLRGSIKNIVTTFKNARAFIVDEKSKLFNSPIYNFVHDEFKRNSVTLYPRPDFITLTSKEDSELYSKFNFYCNDTTGVNQKIFICTFNDFQKLENPIEQFKKKGNKVIPLSKTYLFLKPKESQSK
jgi:hypothetical protein